MYRYSLPPQGYVPYDFMASPPTSPSPQYAYNPHNPQCNTPRGYSKRHSHKFSSDGTYSSPRGPGWYSPAGYPSPGFYSKVPDYTSPPQHDYVSPSGGGKSQSRRFSTTSGYRPRSGSRSQTQYIYVDVSEDAYYSQAYSIPKRRESKSSSKKFDADRATWYYQVPAYDDQKPHTPKPRRQSHSTHSKSSTPKPKTQSSKPVPKATEADAVKAGIPAGYSIKNWDPTETPILLLGSVFDANSLGKWIYDWTVYHHGAATPMSEVAGDMWLLLIKLAGKMKRAEECLPKIRSADNKEMIDDFLESGDRLWDRFRKLLKACEEFMWKAAKKEGNKSIQMGKSAGCAFVDSIFGRDRELEKTEKLMTSIRLWNMRFDANCEEILRHPTAA
ncbi:MAG: hypothetical protein M1834_004189 [Cirrosporium novae-zelandiae]|nr:MAG: hypothetical protein M1834_004189 [Cirrosporium novae-zelandiae]